MTYLVIFGILALLGFILIQISKVRDLSAKIRGEAAVEAQNNDRTALYLMVFMVVFLLASVLSAWYYKDVMLGYGPHQAASMHGDSLDFLFNITLFFTGIVFILTHIYLFWFSYKYRAKTGRKALYFPHSTMLEVIWTAVPAFVLVILVVKGLEAWNEVMADVAPGEDYIEIEATGYQFAWDIRYPGADGKLGTKNYRLIDMATNPLGIDWTDEKSIDDVVLSGADKLVLPKGTKVRVRITAKDVLHNFYLPHFRVKMDAIPGLPTYFVFTPKLTTEEYRENLREYDEWNVPYDETEPDGPTRWEAFEYELACAELCGKGHYSMRRVLEIVEPEVYEEWVAEKNAAPYFKDNIRGSDADPYKDKLLGYEIEQRATELRTDFESALSSEVDEEKIINLRHVFFRSGSAELDERSQYELNNLAEILNSNATTKVELRGHTDSTGDAAANFALSDSRALAVQEYLVRKGVIRDNIIARGYGPNIPLESNDTEEGRQKNRRTELKIL